jgi:putative tryptophan/tyrosine transport system substrate-binding protein
VLREPDVTTGVAQFAAMLSVAPALGIELVPLNARDAAEIERAVVALARSGNTGLIMTSSPAIGGHRGLIVRLAAEYRMPAVYPFRYYVTAGGLMSYGPGSADLFRRAASYVDRILKGEKPAELPVQEPTKHELVVNLATAKALGLEIPPTLLARADEVIE